MIDKKKLSELMKNGWSYCGCSSGSGGSGGGSASKYKQPDWGIEENAVEVLPEVALTGEGQMPIVQEFSLIAEQEYTVNWNGVVYKCKAVEVQVDVAMVCVGNIAAVEESGDTGEPFMIACLPAEAVPEMGMYGMVFPLDGSTAVTLSITGAKIHSIPAKYTESSVMYVELDTENKTTKKTYNELLAAIKAGKLLVAVGVNEVTIEGVKQTSFIYYHFTGINHNGSLIFYLAQMNATLSVDTEGNFTIS